MNILFVITKANWGGAQRYVYDLAVAISERGARVAVAYGERGELADRLLSANIQAYEIKALSRDVGLVREFAALLRLAKLFRKVRPDVVHINSSKAGALGCLAARLSGIPRIIFTAHGWAFHEARPWWQRAFLYLASGTIVLLSHETICNSQATKRAIAAFPFVKKKLSVIPLGIDPPRFFSRDEARRALLPEGTSRYLVGMISELHPTKRICDAIDALALIVETAPDTLLVVIGEGEDRGRIEAHILKRHVQDCVVLAGFKSNAAVLLPAFDLFLHTSASEASGYVLLEAGLAGLPVVATNVGGIPELITDGVHGILVPPKNPARCAAAISLMRHDTVDAAHLGRNLYNRTHQDFTKEKMIKATLHRYKL